MDNRSLSHTKYRCQYHVVFIPKYRKKVLYGQMREDVREIIQELCKYKGVEIISGAVCVDHVHLSVFNAAEVEHIKLHGISEGEEHIDDL